MLREIYRYFLARKKFWLFPVFLALLAIGGLLFVSSGSVLAPFIYTLF